MPEKKINGNRMHYQLDGPEEGMVVLFSNSLGADLTMWDAVVNELTPSLRVLRYDTRGHGQTPALPPPVTIADLGEDVIALLNELAIPKVHFCGLSMGGLIGQWLAIHHPERIDKLILSNTAAKIGTNVSWNERIDTVRRYGLSDVANAALDRWLTPEFREQHPAVRDHWVNRFRETDDQGYAACCMAIRNADFREDLHQIKAPTLIIAGTHDPVTTVTDGQFMQQAIPDAQLVELPAAHLSAVESADAFARTLNTFLAEPELSPNQPTYEAGMAARRAVLGDAHVDRANAGTTDFTTDFQDFITRYAWGEIWTRPGLSRHARSLITLGMLIALNRETEFKMHVRAALNNGVTMDEIKEVIMHSALYCGLPAANAAFHAASEVLNNPEK
ncbi:3-oxoadipate enol-lactonase [Spirosoma spitsbergense]|uniref:bifunctional 3-oxoadipate enol-lactonase/4-carboxymuconolactone decarboxylase PcaDC n=1 Tax=Spirosoma spitsbergense TaxID=431554 RepID=UPI00036B9048|nr:3-oxoadipate enol-lactonase [Spirosoma spitsbergense]